MNTRFSNMLFGNVHQGYPPGAGGVGQYLAQLALQNPGLPHVEEQYFWGHLTKQKDFAEFCSEFTAQFGGHAIIKTFNEDGISTLFLVWDHGGINIESRSDGDGDSVSINLFTTDSDFRHKVAEFCSTLSQVKKGQIYVLTIGQHGPELTSTGFAGVNLERGNYSEEVLTEYDHITSDLCSRDPCGRIVLLDGKPGTGKTFLVRSLLSEVENARFILTSPDIVPQLAGPNFIKVLMRHASGNGPMVFVVEDADSCLVQRGPDNMGQLSSLLNLSDGILGNVLDIRIVATTNAGHLHDAAEKLDDALLRPGRLCRRVVVPHIPREHAAEVYKRLTKKTFEAPGDSFTLAEVYRYAKDSGYRKEEPKKRAMGFGFSNPPKDIFD